MREEKQDKRKPGTRVCRDEYQSKQFLQQLGNTAH
jgi:hypothetical protein